MGGINKMKSQIIRIVRRSLSCIDERLVDHGERVAYIADKTASMDCDLDVDRDTLFLLCLLHDIGAYKTEEIDNMVNFETDSVVNHAVYGYVFLRNTTTLGDSAEAILYHHTNHCELLHTDTAYKTAAELIFLADRVDILLASPGGPDWDALRRLSGTVFSPALTELFFAAEAKLNISRHIADMSYRDEIEPRINSINLSEEDIIGYLKMLVFSIDFRSPLTVTHTADTSAISSALAELMGMSETERRAIAFGAFLHDIGKIAIPNTILEHPGRLSEEDMATMRTHVEVSEEILKNIVSDEVCQIAVRHHEKLNGTGYPRRLNAAALSLPERIVAVSDILSALSSKRSYKEPFSKEKTVSIIKGMCDAGELCPLVCGTAIENYDYVIGVVSQTDDPVVELYDTIRTQYENLISRFS